MAFIEIKTAHNVVIAYQIATLGERILAFIIDAGALLFLILGIILGMAFIFHTEPGTITSYLILTPLFFFYSLGFEIFNEGRSPGKMVIGLKVIKLTGREANISDYLVRWLFRMIDIYFSLGTLACILISSSLRGQRLGDILAHTAVIKTRNLSTLRLDDILKIRSLESYTPRYPQAAKLTEADALLIKVVLEREKKYPNANNRQNISLLREKLMDELDIPEKSQNAPDFLQTLVKDYVALTR